MFGICCICEDAKSTKATPTSAKSRRSSQKIPSSDVKAAGGGDASTLAATAEHASSNSVQIEVVEKDAPASYSGYAAQADVLGEQQADGVVTVDVDDATEDAPTQKRTRRRSHFVPGGGPAPEDISPAAVTSGMGELQYLVQDPSKVFQGVAVEACMLGMTKAGGLDAVVEGEFKEKSLEQAGCASDVAARSRFLKAGVAVSCAKGRKPGTPNQDNFFVAECGHFLLCCVADGHGIGGHWASHWTCKFVLRMLLEHMSTNKELPAETVMTRIFDIVHQELVCAATTKDFELSLSGTTLSVAVVDRHKKQLLLAWAGDSRCVLGRPSSRSKGKPSCVGASEDHKPNDPKEKARVVESGGEVLLLPGDVPHRIFAKNKEVPGLAMSRSIGDLSGHSVGVIHQPSFKLLEFQKEDLLLCCSDGVWEFLSDADAIGTVLQVGRKNLADAAVKLVSDSRAQWLAESARKERNRLVLLETDFSTGEEADPWESEGSDVELFHSSFVRGGKRRSSTKLERRRESSSKTEVLAKQRILRRSHVRYDFEDIFQRVLAEEQTVNFFTCEGHKPEPAKKKTKKSKQAEEKKDDRQIRFRNYIPRTPELRDFCMPKITSADIEAEIDKEIQEAIAAAEDAEAVLAIAPRKPNWVWGPDGRLLGLGEDGPRSYSDESGAFSYRPESRDSLNGTWLPILHYQSLSLHYTVDGAFEGEGRVHAKLAVDLLSLSTSAAGAILHIQLHRRLQVTLSPFKKFRGDLAIPLKSVCAADFAGIGRSAPPLFRSVLFVLAAFDWAGTSACDARGVSAASGAKECTKRHFADESALGFPLSAKNWQRSGSWSWRLQAPGMPLLASLKKNLSGGSFITSMVKPSVGDQPPSDEEGDPSSQTSTSCASASHPSLSSGDMSGPRVADLGQGAWWICSSDIHEAATSSANVEWLHDHMPGSSVDTEALAEVLAQCVQADDASGSKSNVTAFFPEEMQRLGKLRWDGRYLVACVCVLISRMNLRESLPTFSFCIPCHSRDLHTPFQFYYILCRGHGGLFLAMPCQRSYIWESTGREAGCSFLQKRWTRRIHQESGAVSFRRKPILCFPDMHGCSNLKCFCSASAWQLATLVRRRASGKSLLSSHCTRDIAGRRQVGSPHGPQRGTPVKVSTTFTWKTRSTFALSQRGRSPNFKGSQGPRRSAVAASVLGGACLPCQSQQRILQQSQAQGGG
ncbi:PPC6-7 [Symbiodinium sp. CCMP2456]|nr:PPC6-7 [Symbiodinium sp. CCMP2456]